MVKEIKIEKDGGGFYTLGYQNKLEDNGSELYNAICKIPLRDYLDLYAALKPNFKEIENKIKLFCVVIYMNSVDGKETGPHFSIYVDNNINAGLIFSLFDSKTYDYNFNLQATKVWRDFMHKELGDMYISLLAAHNKESIEREIAENDKKSNDLVARLAQLKQAQAELEQERQQLNQKLAELEGKSATQPAANEETLAPTQEAKN